MRWFIFQPPNNPKPYLVQGKNLASSTKRLIRWSKWSKVDISTVEVMDNGKGYETMSEASMRFSTITMIDGSY